MRPIRFETADTDAWTAIGEGLTRLARAADRLRVGARPAEREHRANEADHTGDGDDPADEAGGDGRAASTDEYKYAIDHADGCADPHDEEGRPLSSDGRVLTRGADTTAATAIRAGAPFYFDPDTGAVLCEAHGQARLEATADEDTDETA